MSRTLLTTLALGALLGSALAQSPPPTRATNETAQAGKEPVRTANEPVHAANDPVRERWEKLSPEEKLRMKDRWERYQALGEDERRELRERAQRLKETRERVEREMTPQVRGQLDRLSPEKRQQIVEELVETEAQKVGQRIREQLPASWIERIEKASPEDRARFFGKFMREQRGRVARFAIEQIGQRLQLAPEEIERMRNLPEAERGQAVLELRKRLSAHDAETLGLPAGLTQAQWDQWQTLPPEEFFERMQRHHREHVAPAAEPEAAHPETNAPATPDTHVPADTHAATDPKAATDAPPAPPRIPPERLRALKRLQDALHAQPEEHLEFSDLNPKERHVRLIERARERCLVAIIEGGLVPPERFDEMRALPAGRLLEATRTILAPLRALQHPPSLQRQPGAGEGGAREHQGSRGGSPHGSPLREGNGEAGGRGNDHERPGAPPRDGSHEGSHDGEAPPPRSRP
jgi:hypothetical protein